MVVAMMIGLPGDGDNGTHCYGNLNLTTVLRWLLLLLVKATMMMMMVIFSLAVVTVTTKLILKEWTLRKATERNGH